MVKNLYVLVCFITFGYLSAVANEISDDTPALEQKVESLLSALSEAEKIKLLTGIGFSLGETLEGTDNFIPGVAGYTWALPERGLPSMLLADGPAGLRFAEPARGEAPERVATAFPIASVVAASWDQKLASDMGRAMGMEARAYGIDIILAPGMNLQRDPLGGRNYEYYSEDPLLSGKIAAAAVRGIQSTGVGATIKHFVANNQETHRTALDTIVDEKTLRELYLRGFEIAVKEGKPAALMTAYNLLNGEHTSESKRLNTDILRGEWGFDGIVMTDWFSGNNPAQQILAGHNLLMPGMERDRESIKKALDSGAMSTAQLDSALKPTLMAILRTSKLEIVAFDPAAHAKIARRVAADGIVLLRNENVLPFKPMGQNVAVFGVGAYDTVSGGTGSGDVAESYTISIADGLKNAGFKIDEKVAAPTLKHIEDFNASLPPRKTIFDPKPRVQDVSIAPTLITEAAADNSAAIITITRSAGEFQDRKIENDFELSAIERGLLSSVSKAFRAQGKPVIVVLNVAAPIELSSWEAEADAVLVAWLGGQEAGSAVADIVSGAINPSARLAQSWPRKYGLLSTAKYFPGEPTSDQPVPAYAGIAQAIPSKVVYREKAKIGYRDQLAQGDNIHYPFGFGLSYSDYAVVEANTALDGDLLHVKASVKNTGAVAGRTVLQIYASANNGDGSKTLIGFAKSESIDPGQSELLAIDIPVRELAKYDTQKSSWVVTAGDYKISFGLSSQDIVAEEVITVGTVCVDC